MSRSLEKISLERTTRFVLLFGIIAIIIGIGILEHKDEEHYTIFILLNEEGKMGDYPVNATLNENISLHTYIENHEGEPTEYMIKIYRGNNDTTIDPINGTFNAEFIGNITVYLKDEQNWTSQIINISFTEIGANQTIIFELWKNENNTWKFIPNQILFIRIEVVENIQIGDTPNNATISEAENQEQNPQTAFLNLEEQLINTTISDSSPTNESVGYDQFTELFVLNYYIHENGETEEILLINFELKITFEL